MLCVDMGGTGRSVCVQAACFDAVLEEDGPTARAAAVFSALIDTVKPHLLRCVGKTRLKQMRAAATDVPEGSYDRLWSTGDGPMTSSASALSCGAVKGDRAADKIMSCDQRALCLDMPWTGDRELRMRLQVSVKDEAGICRLLTSTTLWSLRADVTVPDRWDDTPMHGLYRALRESGAVCTPDGIPEGALRHADALCGNAEDIIIEGRTDDLEELNRSLDDGDEGALAKLWADVLTDNRWLTFDATRQMAAMVEVAEETRRECEEKRPKVDPVAEGLRKKAADDAAARLRDVEEAHRRELDRERARRKETESRLMDQLKEARADSGAARKEAAALKRRLKEAEASSRVGSEDASRDLAEERGRATALQNTVERLDAQVSERDNEIRRLQAQVEALKASVAAVVDPGWGETSMPVSEMVSVPRSLDEVLSLAEQAWPERLLVLESAHEAARAWSGRDMDRPWRALCAVAECLWSLHFAEGGVDEVARFASLTGFKYTPTESKTVSSMPQLREARTFLWEGERTFMPGHVAVTGGSGDSNLRLHLCFDEEGRRIVIGHLGRHLPNTLT
jgi:hypothetical protein